MFAGSDASVIDSYAPGAGEGAGTPSKIFMGYSRPTTITMAAVKNVYSPSGKVVIGAFNPIDANHTLTIYGGTYADKASIGTKTFQPNYSLTVKGGIATDEVQVFSSIASDFVFKPDYKLRPLHEVEKFVKENSHLPEIPSAAELKVTGYKLGEMDDLLLRKVEELTLYMIEMNP
jgi:hypothetical protein